MQTADSHHLETVIATAELDRRRRHPIDHEEESRAFLSLTQAMALQPVDFFNHLVQAALQLSSANSTGISLLNEKKGRFVWPAVAGELKCYLGAGTPSDFGPCGTVIERRSPVLFIRPERHYTYLAPIDPPLEEVLLIPFFINEKPVGTLWAVIHEPDRHFDGEDRRILEGLSNFAASAYGTLANCGALEPLLDMQPLSAQ